MIIEHIIVLLLAICVAALLWVYQLRMRKISKLESVNSEHEKELKARAKRIIDDANAEAIRIVDSAHVDAKKIQNSLDSKLDAVNETELKEYKQTIQKVSKDIEDSSVREIIEGKNIVDDKMRELLKTAEQQVDDYKQKKIIEINNRMMSFIKELSLKVLSDSIKPETQKEFILKSLEEAKEGHVF